MQPDDFQTVSVIGAGTMGHGFAIVFALAGRSVSLYDVEAEALDRARDQIENGLETLVAAGRITEEEADDAPGRIGTGTEIPAVVSDADLVIEASPEDMEIKKDVFSSLDEHAPATAVLASNTSQLSISEMADQVDDPTRVLGTHWFNPPYVVPLVEVIHGDETDDAVAEVIYELLEEIGKTPVMVQKDIPGFIANRLQTAMDYEAWSLLDRGIASAEDIDRAVSTGFGLRTPALGVFRKSDFAGLDIIRDVTASLTPELDRGTEPSDRLLEMTGEGKLGLKTGEGVFDWRDRDTDEVYEERDQELLALVDLYEEIQENRGA